MPLMLSEVSARDEDETAMPARCHLQHRNSSAHKEGKGDPAKLGSGGRGRRSCQKFVGTTWRALTAIAASVVVMNATALAQDSTSGGVAIGEADAGVTDRAYVTAPPNYAYIIERGAGSFLDCGEGMDSHKTDEAGRDTAFLQCGVTLTETIFIPTAAASARIIVHY